MFLFDIRTLHSKPVAPTSLTLAKDLAVNSPQNPEILLPTSGSREAWGITHRQSDSPGQPQAISCRFITDSVTKGRPGVLEKGGILGALVVGIYMPVEKDLGRKLNKRNGAKQRRARHR